MAEGIRLIVWIGFLGALGSLSRFGVNHWVKNVPWLAASPIPLSTLLVNVLGSLAYGAIWAWGSERGVLNKPLCQALLTGYLGGLTTFSTYSFEALTIGKAHGRGMAIQHLAVHLILGLAACHLGLWLGAPSQTNLPHNPSSS